MKSNRFLAILLLGSAAVLSFVIGGILPFLALHWGGLENRSARNDVRLFDWESDSLESEEPRTLLDDLSARYLEGVADRLGDDFDQGFYQNVVQTGRDQLAEMAYPPEVSDESFDLLTRLGQDFESSENDADDENSAKDDAMEEALAFLMELNGEEAANGGNFLVNAEESPSEQTLDFSSLPIQFWTGNPLNELCGGTASDFRLNGTPRFISSTQTMAEWSSLSYLCGWLFTLLTLVVAMAQPDGVFLPLAGSAVLTLRRFFQWITKFLLRFCRMLLGFISSLWKANLESFGRRILGIFCEFDSLREKKKVVLRL